MSVTKSCARAGRGCSGLVTAPGPRTLAKHRFCSRSCGVRARLEAGWRPDRALTYAQRRRGGIAGGKRAGVSRRKRALIGAVRQLAGFLTPEFLDGLTPAQAARIRVLLGRAYRRGHRCGYRAGHAARPAAARTRKAA